MAEKKAIMGLDRVKVYPVIKNDYDGYAVDTENGFYLPNVQSMTVETDSSETKIYADDSMYMNFKTWNGMNATITFADMELETMAKLGFGTYDALTETLHWNPQGINLELALTFRALMANQQYRMQKMFSFGVTECKPSGYNTKGDSSEITSYEVTGTFMVRKLDGSPADIKDGTDISWLDDLDSTSKVGIKP